MNKDVKEDWVKALRSGDFKQGTGRLRLRLPHKKTQHCCLGVLCEIRGLERSGNMYSFGGTGGTQVLPCFFRRDIALGQDEQDTLIEMNDNGGSFLQIADWIEKNL